MSRWGAVRACACVLSLLFASAFGHATRASGRPASAAREDLSRDTLAWVGARAVTAEDLKDRVELMPWAGPEGGAESDTVNVRALESLVAEKLLAQEAERRGLGTTGPMAGMRAALARALARDALYRQEVGGDSARADAVLARVLSGRRATVERATFQLLADSLRARMTATRAARTRPDGRIRILTQDVDALVTRLARERGRVLVTIPDGSLSLEDVLEDLRFYEFSVRSLKPGRFESDLNAHLKVVVERDLLAQEALRLRLDRQPEVRRDLATWTDAWRARELAARVAGEIADSSAEARARRLEAFVAGLARREGVRLDLGRLQAASFTPARMITRRVLGFGGGMLAAPGLVPAWDWARLWRGGRAPVP